MKGRRTAIIIVAAAILILLVYFLFLTNQQRRVNWYTSFKEEAERPYDLSVISKLLDSYFPDKSFKHINKPLSETLPYDSASRKSYVFIGATLFLDDEDLERLYDFVRSGNDVFISANRLPDEILFALFPRDEYYDYDFFSTYQATVRLNFTHPSLQKTGGYWYDFIYDWEKQPYSWRYFPDTLMSNDTDQYAVLGNINEEYINFIRVPFGNGTFYLHTEPIVFTNYFLKSKESLEYAEKVFSHLTASDIYWDEFSKVPQFDGGGSVGNTETPLRYILSQPALKWAWYILLGLVLLFLLFRIKRDQRIIPVLEQNENTSLEFIHTIGRLYFLQNDHRALANQQMKLFLGFIRSRYNLPTKTIDTPFLQKVSEKSQVRSETIDDLFNHYKTIESLADITPQQLFSFHEKLTSFYKTCK